MLLVCCLSDHEKAATRIREGILTLLARCIWESARGDNCRADIRAFE
jgi:hypothetical protein